MRKNGLILTLVATLTLTAVATRPISWSEGQATTSASRIKAVVPPADENVLATTAALRWRNCQPRHWHHCLVQK